MSSGPRASKLAHAGRSASSQLSGEIPASSGRLWLRQFRGLLDFELRQHFFSRRFWIVYLLAAAPVGLMVLRLIISGHFLAVGARPGSGAGGSDLAARLGGETVLYAVLFRTFTLRMVIFFVCLAVFMYLFRGEILRRTLHYYLLTPLRREVLVAGKFAAGFLFCISVLSASTVASFLLALQTSPTWTRYLFEGPGPSHLAAYLLIVALACMGYGALFLLMGLIFRNPIIPAALVLGLESINFLLPPLLKGFSVIYYLESLAPVPIPHNPITILSDPAPIWLAVPGLAAFSVLLLLAATLRLRRVEVLYGED